jgi:acetyl-CoA synthetase
MSNNIESVMHEDRVFEPPKEFASKARIGSMAAYQAMCDEAAADYPGFWAKRAREELSWKKPFTRVLDESNAPFYKWFDDGLIQLPGSQHREWAGR